MRGQGEPAAGGEAAARPPGPASERHRRAEPPAAPARGGASHGKALESPLTTPGVGSYPPAAGLAGRHAHTGRLEGSVWGTATRG